MHLIAEAKDKASLCRGIKGLQVRLARRLNVLFGRSGRLFGDRYHARALATPREVRHALAYVLLNHRKHAHQSGRALPRALDACSSAYHFDGWSRAPRGLVHDDGPAPIVPANVWLLSSGWKRHGLIALDEVPAAR